MNLRLFDSHTHLQAPEFDADRNAVLDRARRAGLIGQLVLGWDLPSSESAIALAEAEPGIVAAAGCHPHSAKEMDAASLRHLAELAAQSNVAVVGEIGLDFYRSFSPQDAQIEVLNRQLDTASDVGKPVALHGRDAHEQLLPIIETWSRRMGGALPDSRPLGVMHYFDGDAVLAQRYVDLGFVISIHCSVTYPKAEKQQEVAAQLPLHVLVLETDSPFGPPQSRRGERNEPGYVVEAVAKIAQLRGDRIERVADVTTENALRLLGIAAQGRPSLQGAGIGKGTAP